MPGYTVVPTTDKIEVGFGEEFTISCKAKSLLVEDHSRVTYVIQNAGVVVFQDTASKRTAIDKILGRSARTIARAVSLAGKGSGQVVIECELTGQDGQRATLPVAMLLRPSGAMALTSGTRSGKRSGKRATARRRGK